MTDRRLSSSPSAFTAFRKTPGGFCWRPGRWLFAKHRVFTALPSIERFPDGGFTVWWLWFEIAWA